MKSFKLICYFLNVHFHLDFFLLKYLDLFILCYCLILQLRYFPLFNFVFINQSLILHVLFLDSFSSVFD